jgi:hypothetical protein
MLCGLVKVAQRFRGTCTACYVLHDGFLIGILFYPEDEDDMYL